MNKYLSFFAAIILTCANYNAALVGMDSRNEPSRTRSAPPPAERDGAQTDDHHDTRKNLDGRSFLRKVICSKKVMLGAPAAIYFAWKLFQLSQCPATMTTAAAECLVEAAQTSLTTEQALAFLASISGDIQHLSAEAITALRETAWTILSQPVITESVRSVCNHVLAVLPGNVTVG